MLAGGLDGATDGNATLAPPCWEHTYAAKNFVSTFEIEQYHERKVGSESYHESKRLQS